MKHKKLQANMHVLMFSCNLEITSKHVCWYFLHLVPTLPPNDKGLLCCGVDKTQSGVADSSSRTEKATMYSPAPAVWITSAYIDGSLAFHKPSA